MDFKDKLDIIVRNMSPAQKAGQMIMGQIQGTYLTEDFENYLKKYPLGAYRMCMYNILDEKQVGKFNNAICKTFRKMNLPEPIIATDEEGGTLCVFRGIIQDFPGTMALGATRSPELARQQAKAIAQRMCNMGLTMNFTPVCDINLVPSNTVVGVRSYSDDPALAAQLALATALGTNEGGIGNCAKHFPGHGGTIEDTHYDLARDHISYEEFVRTELASFAPLAKAQVDSIFACHVIYPEIDDKYPASMSPIFIEKILRSDLDYKGVIMTDDLMMKAIADNFGVPQAALMHIKAGGDIAMVCGDQKIVGDTFELFLDNILNGNLSIEKVNQSVRRILMLKEKIRNYQSTYSKDYIDADKLSKKICASALTMIKDKNSIIPIDQGVRALIIMPELKNLSESDTSAGLKINLEKYLKEYIETVHTVTIPIEIQENGFEKVLKISGNYDLIIQGTSGALKYRGQIELMKKLSQKKPVVAIMLREPYDAMLIPDNIAVVCAFSGIDNSMECIAHALLGEAEFPGVLPVKIDGEIK